MASTAKRICTWYAPDGSLYRECRGLAQVAAGLVVAGRKHRAAGVRKVNLALAVRDEDAMRAQEIHAENHLRSRRVAVCRLTAAELAHHGVAREVGDAQRRIA